MQGVWLTSAESLHCAIEKTPQNIQIECSSNVKSKTEGGIWNTIKINIFQISIEVETMGTLEDVGEQVESKFKIHGMGFSQR